MEGQIGNNLIDFIPSVSTENDCKSLCAEREGCSHFTYHQENNVGFPKTCFLLNSLNHPIKPCENCITSPINCENSICGFLDANGSLSNAMVLKESTKVNTVQLGKCIGELKALAIGHGG